MDYKTGIDIHVLSFSVLVQLVGTGACDLKQNTVISSHLHTK